MFRRSYHPIVLTIIGLALLGIGVQMFTNTSAFFTQVFVTIGIVALLIFVIKTFIMPKLLRRQGGFGQAHGGSPQWQQTKKKKSASFSTKKKDKKAISRPLIKRQSDVKLTVIEGKKNKKKSRALF
jgi:small-conductance mechanosensitive channel